MFVHYPLLSIEEARDYEASVLSGNDELTGEAMSNAGRAIGRRILDDFRELRPWPDCPSVLVLSGKGLNSGDAFVACSLLLERLGNLKATIVLTEDVGSMGPLARAALDRLEEQMSGNLATLSVEAFLNGPQEPFDLVIDGLYGHGFRPPLRQQPKELLSYVNSRGDIGMRAAIDLPSGMGTETDPGCFVADFTYIPGVAKAPCFAQENTAYTGRLRFLEIEPFLDQSIGDKDECVASPKSHLDLNRLRRAQSDKRNYGHCLVLAGSSQMPGAALMATLAALKSGAGLVTTCTAGNAALHIAAAAPEAMWRSLPMTGDGGLDTEAIRTVMNLAERCDAVLIGPGLNLTRSTVLGINRIIREIRLPVVLDASALVMEIVASVIGRPASAGPVVLTPHLGEFSRLAGLPAEKIRKQHLIQFSRKYRTITLLKGSPSRVSDGNFCYELPVGGPVLARGGAGDILAGMVVSLLSRFPDEPLDAVVRAACWHGAAADDLAARQGATAVRTTDLLSSLSSTLRTQD